MRKSNFQKLIKSFSSGSKSKEEPLDRACTVFLMEPCSLVISEFVVGRGPYQAGGIKVLNTNASAKEIGDAVCQSLEAFREYPKGFDASALDPLPFLTRKLGIKSWRAFYKKVHHGFSIQEEEDSLLVYPMLIKGTSGVFDGKNKRYLPLESEEIGRYFLTFRNKMDEATEK